MFSLSELVLPLFALIAVVFGVSFGLHRNTAFTIFTFFFVLSDIVNPVLFLNNEKMYRESPWGYVKNYDFSFRQLLLSYADSEFIFIIISSCVMFIFLMDNARPNRDSSSVFRIASPILRSSRDRLIGISIIVFAALNFLTYHYRLGITGVAGDAPFHLSGLIHYLRSYLIPVVLALVIGKYQPGKFTVAAIFLYAFLAGIASASRFVAVIPILILIYSFQQRGRWGAIFVSSAYIILLWLSISTSRILTFSKERYDIAHVIYYALTENSGESIVGFFDLLTGRLSGAQQVVLVHQLKGTVDCSHLTTFLLGGSICTNTASNVFNLDLSGTAYGIGLSVIPSIMISSTSRLDYIFPAVVLGCFLFVTNIVHKTISNVSGFPLVAFLYLVFSCIFLFAGPLRFFYYLQGMTFILLCAVKFWRLKRHTHDGS